MLTLLAVVVVAVRVLPLRVVLPVVPLAYTLAWSVTAVANDDQGLWPIGAIMVLVGTTAGTALVAPATAVAYRGFRRRSTA